LAFPFGWSFPGRQRGDGSSKARAEGHKQSRCTYTVSSLRSSLLYSSVNNHDRLPNTVFDNHDLSTLFSSSTHRLSHALFNDCRYLPYRHLASLVICHYTQSFISSRTRINLKRTNTFLGYTSVSSDSPTAIPIIKDHFLSHHQDTSLGVAPVARTNHAKDREPLYIVKNVPEGRTNDDSTVNHLVFRL